MTKESGPQSPQSPPLTQVARDGMWTLETIMSSVGLVLLVMGHMGLGVFMGHELALARLGIGDLSTLETSMCLVGLSLSLLIVLGLLGLALARSLVTNGAVAIRTRVARLLSEIPKK